MYATTAVLWYEIQFTAIFNVTQVYGCPNIERDMGQMMLHLKFLAGSKQIKRGSYRCRYGCGSGLRRCRNRKTSGLYTRRM